jgi:hypothetical protein
VDPQAIGFCAEELVGNFFNILLSDEKDNYSLFEYIGNGCYSGHYFFYSARGREAINLAKEMLEVFTDHDPSAKSIMGLVPKYNKKTRWITRQLGFNLVGTMEHEQLGEIEIFHYKLQETDNTI